MSNTSHSCLPDQWKEDPEVFVFNICLVMLLGTLGNMFTLTTETEFNAAKTLIAMPSVYLFRWRTPLCKNYLDLIVEISQAT